MDIEEKESISTPEADLLFNKHLLLSNNQRILFSAKFGDGKTTFLRNFFKAHSSNFAYIHLYPVNYSVASNEDIFELIKFDILFDLLGSHEIEFKDAEVTLSVFAAKYAKGNKTKLIKLFTPFLKTIPSLGDSLFESTERILDILNDFVDKYQNESKDEIGIIESHLEKFTQQEGSIYEENFYTQLISDLVKRLSNIDIDEKKENRKTVLIIDDLDRIDPEHIFRILNIFASHQDHHSGNKFGFDKVIVVCDIDNIRNIFSHKYGSNTDFNGYIDKFFSVDIFYYSMKAILIDKLESILLSANGNERFSKLIQLKTLVYTELFFLLKSFIITDIINVRNIIKIREISFELNQYKLGFKRYENVELWGILLFNILKIVFGDYISLLKAFEKLSLSEINEIDLNSGNKGRLGFILLPIMTFCRGSDGKASLRLPSVIPDSNESVSVELAPSTNQYSNASIQNATINEEENFQFGNVNYAELYFQVFQAAMKNGFLK